MTRRGSVLLVAAGIAALLAALAIAFLARMRDDADEMDAVTREAQARLMLLAACDYVMEASRLGYDAPTTPEHEEAFGWIDVRDGRLGPKLVADGLDHADAWPLYRARRFPMHVLTVPPYAVRLNVVYNPIPTPATPTAAPWPDPLGRPYLLRPDPQPALDGWAAYRDGDPRPRADSVGMSWFRLFRDGGARFVVTCGAGGTEGFRDWGEVQAGAATAEFGDQEAFESIRSAETRRWYLIEWTGAVTAPDYHNLDNDIDTQIDNFQVHPMNASHAVGVESCRTQNHACDPVGSISWVQRLTTEPTWW